MSEPTEHRTEKRISDDESHAEFEKVMREKGWKLKETHTGHPSVVWLSGLTPQAHV